jgi:hypothetical protein
VRRPFYACAAGIWSVSDPIKNPHLRAGARVALSLYFVTLFSFLLFIAAEIIIGLVIAVAMIGLMFWFFAHYDELRHGELPRRAHPERVIHHDAHGNKTGESVEVEGVFGRYTEHFDAHGNKVGESRSETGIFGDKEVHSDRTGTEIGECREETGILGDSTTIHYDRAADKVGESRPKEDLLGNDVIEHFDKKGNKTGESR